MRQQRLVVHTGGIERRPSFLVDAGGEKHFEGMSAEEQDEARIEKIEASGQTLETASNEPLIPAGDVIATGEIPAPKENIRAAEEAGLRDEQTTSEVGPLGDDLSRDPETGLTGNEGTSREGGIEFTASKNLDNAVSEDRSYATLSAMSKADLEKMAEGTEVKGTGANGNVTKDDLIAALRNDR